MRRKGIGIKDMVILIIIIFIFGDFFFNDRILLTKFSTKFTEVSASIGERVGEWWAEIIIKDM